MPQSITNHILHRTRTLVGQRAELPDMSLPRHLEELRWRTIHLVIYLVAEFFFSMGLYERICAVMLAPMSYALKPEIEKFHLYWLKRTGQVNSALTCSVLLGRMQCILQGAKSGWENLPVTPQ